MILRKFWNYSEKCFVLIFVIGVAYFFLFCSSIFLYKTNFIFCEVISSEHYKSTNNTEFWNSDIGKSIIISNRLSDNKGKISWHPGLRPKKLSYLMQMNIILKRVNLVQIVDLNFSICLYKKIYIWSAGVWKMKVRFTQILKSTQSWISNWIFWKSITFYCRLAFVFYIGGSTSKWKNVTFLFKKIMLIRSILKTVIFFTHTTVNKTKPILIFATLTNSLLLGCF